MSKPQKPLTPEQQEALDQYTLVTRIRGANLTKLSNDKLRAIVDIIDDRPPVLVQQKAWTPEEREQISKEIADWKKKGDILVVKDSPIGVQTAKPETVEVPVETKQVIPEGELAKPKAWVGKKEPSIARTSTRRDAAEKAVRNALEKKTAPKKPKPMSKGRTKSKA